MKTVSKQCTKCDLEKPLAEFAKDARCKDGRRSMCTSCAALAMREYRATDRGREITNRIQRDYYRRAKLEAIAYYSRGTMSCACCGEGELVFLTIDHVNGDGAEHRRQTRDTNVGVVLKRAGWPDGYQVLCFNCNCGRERNGGICPHQQARLSLIQGGSA